MGEHILFVILNDNGNISLNLPICTLIIHTFCISNFSVCMQNFAIQKEGHMKMKCAIVAVWIRHWTLTQGVTGSNPYHSFCVLEQVTFHHCTAPWRGLRLFSHDGKVRILNRDSRCASWITIRNTVFWTMCMPNHVEIRDLAYTRSKIPYSNRIVIQDAHLESRFKIRTLPSCENSPNAVSPILVCSLLVARIKNIYISNFNEQNIKKIVIF